MKPTHSQTPLRFPVDSLCPDGPVDRCHNLRPSPSGKSLVAVGTPANLPAALPPGSRLLPGGIFRDSGGSLTLLLSDDGGLLCCDDGQVYRPEGCKGSPRCVLSLGDSLLVMNGEGEAPLVLVREGGRWQCRSTDVLPPPLTITRRDEGLISTTTPATMLHDSYNSRSGRLGAADAAAMGKVVTDAYLALGNQAVARRAFFQPVMARYRLRGADGAVLYTSAPVLIGPDSGVQAISASFQLTGSGFNNLAASTLTARAFSLRLSGRLDESWAAVVSHAELLVSPQLHPLEEGLDAPHVLGSFTTSSATLTVRLPGVNTSAVSAASPQTLLHSHVAAMLGRLDSALEQVGAARYDRVSASWQGLDSPFYADRRDCMADIKALRRAVAASASGFSTAASAIRSMSQPHLLSAATVGVSGDTVVLCGLSARRFCGSLPQEFAVEAGTSTQPSAVKVSFADGSSVTRSFAGGLAVSQLSPLLTYPSADAVEMQLISGTASRTVALQPDPSGTMAYWLDPSGAPVGFSGSLAAFADPEPKPKPRLFPGLVAVSSLAAPLKPLAVVEDAGAAPLAAVAVPGSQGGWDAGSSRFYLLGPSGVQSLTVNSSRSRLTIRTLDRRPVVSNMAVCTAGSVVAAIAGGDLVTLNLQRVTTLLPSAGVSALGYVGKTDELLCFPSDESGSVTVISPDGSVRFTRSNPGLQSLLSVPPGLWITSVDGQLLDYADEHPAEVDVAYRASIPLADPRPGLRMLGLPLTGDVAGSLEISADNGGGHASADRLASFVLDGHVTHLPRIALLIPHRHRLTLSFELKASDFCFGI